MSMMREADMASSSHGLVKKPILNRECFSERKL